MKIKLKISIEQLHLLVHYAGDFLQRIEQDIIYSTLEKINLKSFIRFGMKKVIDESINRTNKEKIKTFSIDVNMLEALKTALTIDFNRNNLNSLYLALYMDLQQQIRKQIILLNNSIN